MFNRPYMDLTTPEKANRLNVIGTVPTECGRCHVDLVYPNLPVPHPINEVWVCKRCEAIVLSILENTWII